MARIQALGKDVLADAAGSPGITRHMAFVGEGFQIVRSRIDAGVVSGWHHHGDHDLYGYMVSGTAHFEDGPGGRDVTSVGPGDFFYLPARMVHRDVNPSTTEGQEIIVFLRGAGPIVVNVDGPDPG